MTLSQAILHDLSAGQSTSDSIAGRMKITDQHAEALLTRHLADGYVSTHPLQIDGKDALTVYRLTAKPIL